MVRLDRVREAREHSGLTQEEVARQLGYKSANAIGNKEQGDRNFSTEDLIKLSSLYHVSVDWLLGMSNREDSYRFDVTAEELNLLRWYRGASDRDKKIVLNILQTSLKE